MNIDVHESLEGYVMNPIPIPTSSIPIVDPCVSLSSSDSELIIPMNTCNHENLTIFDMSAFKNLRFIEISDKNFYYVTSFRIIGLPHLYDIMIGMDSFSGAFPQVDYSFVIAHCPLLTSIQIGMNSFLYYGNEFTIQGCPLLKDLLLEGFNFQHSQLVLNRMIIG